jgi:hypothetical protein
MTMFLEATSSAISPSDLRPSVYLTDGHRLFRVVRAPATAPYEGAAVLEDCRTLQELTFTPAELSTMPLRVVATQAAGVAA